MRKLRGIDVDLVQRTVIASAVVELGHLGRLVSRDVLRFSSVPPLGR
jgi:hypothetical protein